MTELFKERWTDMMDSDDESVEMDEDIEIPSPNSGHAYMHPFTIGQYAIRTSGDFVYHMQAIFELFMLNYNSPQPETAWADMVRGLTDSSDTENMDAASFEFMIMMLDMEITEETFVCLDDSDVNIPIEEVNVIFAEEAKDALEVAVAEITLDMFDEDHEALNFMIPRNAHKYPKKVSTAASTPAPPLAPICPDSKAIVLRLCAGETGAVNISQDRIFWQDLIKTISDDFPSEKVGGDLNDATMASSRSNIRPESKGAVHVIFESGEAVNVGSHGYLISKDHDFPLDFDGSNISLQEFFSAPGGEGLTCPSPSHVLHQIASAVLSSAIKSGCVEVEEDNIDIRAPGLSSHEFPHLHIDITTSAGIWNKKLAPDASNTDFRHQAAISKYDLSSIIISQSGINVAKCIARATANCLSCEFPGLFREDRIDVPDDLKMQAAIYDRIGTMSQNSIKKLGSMCYEAAVSESLVEVNTVDTKHQGKPWKEKRDIMIKAVNKLKGRSNFAFPPLPLTEITPLPQGVISVTINGHNFSTGAYLIQGRSQGPLYSMVNPKSFLAHFPANGIISEDDGRAIARVLDKTPLKATGRTHRGPAEGFVGKDSVYMDAAGDVYSSSASAQFSEIRADLVRAIHKCPMPKENMWAQVYIYKGKVSCWYRCRDAPNSPEGYRIDWFAISTFQTAGSKRIVTDQGDQVYLWPRQRMRSQEMSLTHMAPRRLKLILYSMLEKAKAGRADYSDIILAWERLAITINASTFASGKLFLTCRHLSSTLSSPSSPFHEMAKKLVPPRNYADLMYLDRLSGVLTNWVKRDQYRSTAPLLGISRSYSQLESYWNMWVPCEFADSNKNMADCVIGLCKEALHLDLTMDMRVRDMEQQYDLFQMGEIRVEDLRRSLRASCSLNTDGKLGWTWIGSLASGHALNLRASAAGFDRRYGRGTTARTMVDNMTVRHSARIDKNKNLVKGTVAELMIDSGIDDFLSDVNQTYRFLFINLPTFFNHGKNKEHKEREISITDPDSRICLTSGELICGRYGKTTGIDFLKDSNKNAKFYRTSSRVMQRGGGIQSSDATRYGPNMSNFAIAIMLILLGTYSMHLRWASVIYARLAYRRMLLPTAIKPYLSKYAGHADTKDNAINTLNWMSDMPVACREDGVPHVAYTTSHHMGQGMSHHSSSLLHAGGIVVAVDSVLRTQVSIKGKIVTFNAHIMVTSDDSTIMVEPEPQEVGQYLSRSEKQAAARLFLQMIRAARQISLRMVSVLANLVKEMISATKGEFNSQDTGIGETCPILGFRELLSLIVSPTAPSLVGDYLNAHACARDIAFAGQGLSSGNIAHRILIDCIEERWGLKLDEKEFIKSLKIIPKQLHNGCQDYELASSPCSWLDPRHRAVLYRLSVEKNVSSEDLDPHTKDTIYSPLMHIKVSMSRQHKNAIKVLNREIKRYEKMGHTHQASLLQESLRSTLSSARTRNLGRVAMRVRNREMTPRDYLKKKFTKNTIIQHTLDWLDTINRQVMTSEVSAADIRQSNHLAGFVKLVSRQRFGFPRPPRLRRFASEPIKKPRFRVKGYGATPFGRHALKRSGTSVVDKITNIEREVMQVYLARKMHRKVSEHIEYGGSFVTSWANYECAIIIALDISADIASQELERMKWGNFGERGSRILKELQLSFPDNAVLALHTHDGTRGLWHCIFNGNPITVHKACDLEVHDSNAIQHQMEDGKYVYLALQGVEDNHLWNDSIPKPDEIERYQRSNYNDHMPSITRTIEDQNMVSSNVIGATYSTVLPIDGVDSMVYVAPEVHYLPRDNPTLLPKVPQLRARVIASLATGGYWHTSLRGTAFRSFLKGHYQDETIWTGQALGWRSSSTSIPVYFVTESHTTNVKGLIILGGINDPDLLSPYNPDIFSPGYKVISESNTLTYSKCIRVDSTYKDFILTNNGGDRFHTGNNRSSFMNFMNGPAPTNYGIMSREYSRIQIKRKLVGQASDEGW